MHRFEPRPPEAAYGKYVHCGYCSVTHKNLDTHDTHPQCPWCGNLIDLSGHTKRLEPNPDDARSH